MQLAPSVNGRNPEPAAEDFEALGEQVLLEPISQDMTAGGIVMPENVVGAILTTAKVVNVGPGAYAAQTGQFIPTTLVPGDIVFLVGIGSPPFPLGDKDYIVVRESLVTGRQKRKQETEN